MNGARLKELRDDNNDTQTSLAEKLGVTRDAVAAWEQGRSNPKVEILIDICNLYHVSADYLLGLNDDDPFLKKGLKYELTKEEMLEVREFADFVRWRRLGK